MPIITICCSVAFYRQAADIETKLKKFPGYKVIVPSTVHVMKKSGDFEVDHYKTWFADPGDYHKKALFIREHFAEVARGDAVLVLNYEKHGKANYIGGNVLMEMAIGFHLNKQIFILNEIPEDSPFLEEILGMQPIVLHGKLADLSKKYHKLAPISEELQ